MSKQPHRTGRMVVPLSTPTTESQGDTLSQARGAADATLLIERVSGELAGLSLAVEDMQAGLGPVIVAAATHSPGVILQAQKLDLVAQWLGGLSVFLSALQHWEIGREPLDFDGVAATLGLKSLGERLAGRVAETVVEDVELF